MNAGVKKVLSILILGVLVYVLTLGVGSDRSERAQEEFGTFIARFEEYEDHRALIDATIEEHHDRLYRLNRSRRGVGGRRGGAYRGFDREHYQDQMCLELHAALTAVDLKEVAVRLEQFRASEPRQ